MRELGVDQAGLKRVRKKLTKLNQRYPAFYYSGYPAQGFGPGSGLT